MLRNNATDNLQYLVYHVFSVVYSIFFGPLSKVPGPWYLAASRIPYIRQNLNGTLLPWMQELHEKYGPMVRYTPNEVSAQERTVLAVATTVWHYLNCTHSITTSIIAQLTPEQGFCHLG